MQFQALIQYKNKRKLFSFYLALAVEGGGSGAVGFAAQPQRQQPSAPSGKTMSGVVIGERYLVPEPPWGKVVRQMDPLFDIFF